MNSITTLEQLNIIYFSSSYNKIFSYFLNFSMFHIGIETIIIIFYRNRYLVSSDTLEHIICTYLMNRGHCSVTSKPSWEKRAWNEQKVFIHFFIFIDFLNLMKIFPNWNCFLMSSVVYWFLPGSWHYELCNPKDTLNQNILMRRTKSFCQSPLWSFSHCSTESRRWFQMWKVLTSTQWLVFTSSQTEFE